MVYLIAGLIALVIAQILFTTGVPPWAVLLASSMALLFWHRFLGVVAFGMIMLSQALERAGLPGNQALRDATRWLTSVEGVRAADGNWMKPSDVATVTRSERTNTAKDAQAAALRSEAEIIFEQQCEDAVFLVQERNGHSRCRSKIGGLPTLPSELDWPELDEYALHFLAEIHLDEVPRPPAPNALPATGVLYFFLELSEYSDMVDGRVLYAPQAGPRPVARHPHLQDLQQCFASQPDDSGLIVQTTVRPTVAPVPYLAGFDRSSVSEDLMHSIDTVSMEHFFTALRAAGLVDGTQELHAEKCYVYSMIGGPKIDIPNPTKGHGVKLLQLDSANNLGLQFGDAGVVEFWIEEEDLRLGRFERAFVDGASC